MDNRDSRGRFVKGRISWNKNLKGIHLSLETEFKKGCQINLGKKRPDVSERNRKNKGKRLSIFSEFKKGYRPWNYKGGKDTKNNQIRQSDEYKKWRRDVYIKDQYTCQYCGQKHIDIVAHHIKSFADFFDLRFEIANGIVLCKSCHAKLHKEERGIDKMGRIKGRGIPDGSGTVGFGRGMGPGKGKADGSGMRKAGTSRPASRKSSGRK